ncbi:MAG: SatD family protein [Gemmatimonadota bacterium]
MDGGKGAMSDGRQYFALIGDLVGSRELEDRAEVQVRFRAAIRGLNETWTSELAVPLKLTAGDEVQGLLTDPRAVLAIVLAVSDAVLPARICWGLGRGALSTDLVADVALLDGPCFHRAREAVESAKRSSRWLRAGGVAEPDGRVLAGLMNLMGAIRSGWTARQAEVVREARGRKQVDVAEALGVHRSTISRTLASAHYEEVMEGEEAVQSLLGAWSGDRSRGEELP